MFRILREKPDDSAEVEFLFDLAFAPGRTALSSYRLRDGVEAVADLSLVARDEYDVIAGAIRYWPVRVGEAGTPALLLGPVAVHPTRQGEGLGALLIAESLDRATGKGLDAGDPGRGRALLPALRLQPGGGESARLSPPTNPDRLLARELAPGAFDGVAGMVRRWAEAAGPG